MKARNRGRGGWVDVNPVYAGKTKPKKLTSERGIFTRGPKPHDPEMLRVECWCRATTVGVPRDEVLECRTRSCGADGCAAHLINCPTCEAGR